MKFYEHYLLVMGGGTTQTTTLENIVQFKS